MKQVSYIREMNDRAIQHQSRNITITTANSTIANTGKHYSTIFFQNYNSIIILFRLYLHLKGSFKFIFLSNNYLTLAKYKAQGSTLFKVILYSSF